MTDGIQILKEAIVPHSLHRNNRFMMSMPVLNTIRPRVMQIVYIKDHLAFQTSMPGLNYLLYFTYEIFQEKAKTADRNAYFDKITHITK